ncbi:MAG: hypothetical protein CVV45_19520 [Spirochaetae bacterium HGW-Spirochaetae-10]|nr:MAG: hypothetical protein CVV45_19520 [Spirochaetae bacterium HGW-Spirochaetae-10]
MRRHDIGAAERIKKIILYGSGGERMNFNVKRENLEFKFNRSFEGVIPNLERRRAGRRLQRGE